MGTNTELLEEKKHSGQNGTTSEVSMFSQLHSYIHSSCFLDVETLMFASLLSHRVVVIELHILSV